ncbi:MAG: hypothetical protein ACTS6P_01725 [Candidatus Hodgkinia cicadicola]
MIKICNIINLPRLKVFKTNQWTKTMTSFGKVKQILAVKRITEVRPKSSFSLEY